MRDQSCGKKRESEWGVKVLTSMIQRRMSKIGAQERGLPVPPAVLRPRWMWIEETCNSRVSRVLVIAEGIEESESLYHTSRVAESGHCNRA
eukprot:805700-Karenia_brevis.AAC.1